MLRFAGLNPMAVSTFNSAKFGYLLNQLFNHASSFTVKKAALVLVLILWILYQFGIIQLSKRYGQYLMLSCHKAF